MTYVLIKFEDVTKEMWKVCVQTNITNLRKLPEPDGRVILKYEGYHPILFWGFQKYNQEELLDLLKELD